MRSATVPRSPRCRRPASRRGAAAPGTGTRRLASADRWNCGRRSTTRPRAPDLPVAFESWPWNVKAASEPGTALGLSVRRWACTFRNGPALPMVLARAPTPAVGQCLRRGGRSDTPRETERQENDVAAVRAPARRHPVPGRRRGGLVTESGLPLPAQRHPQLARLHGVEVHVLDPAGRLTRQAGG